MADISKRLDEFNGAETPYNKPFILQRADPYVLKAEDGSYYFTASYPAYDRIILRKSSSLLGLSDITTEKEIWHCHESGPMSKHIWAPEIHNIFGGWYIYFAGGERDDVWKIRPYVLHCKGNDPFNDEWEELGPLKPADEDIFSFRSFSLDTTSFNVNGKQYIIWAEKVSVGPGISNLYIGELESPVKLKSIQVLLTTPDYDWERVGFWVDEGPAVLKHNGKLYVTFSSSATGACYCMGLLSANEDSDLLDPKSWDKRRFPIVVTDYEKGIYGPGHNSFTKDENGEDICVFHARTYEEIVGNSLYDPNRHAFLMKVRFDEKTDEPIMIFEKNR